MLSQHLLHNTLICIVSDKGVHNDSHYTDMTGEFRFLSAPPLLWDSSSHDDYKRRCWPVQLTLNPMKELTEEDVALTMTEFTWKIMPHIKTLNKRGMSSCVGTVRVCWGIPMSHLTLSPGTREPWHNGTYKTPHFGEIITSASAEIRSNVCRSPHFLLSLAFCQCVNKAQL